MQTDAFQLNAFQQDGGSAGPRTLTADVGTFSLTGIDAGLTVARKLTADVGTFTLTGQDARLAVGRVLVAETGFFTLAGQDANLRGPYRLTAETVTYTFTGIEATLTYSGSSIVPTGADGASRPNPRRRRRLYLGPEDEPQRTEEPDVAPVAEIQALPELQPVEVARAEPAIRLPKPASAVDVFAVAQSVVVPDPNDALAVMLQRAQERRQRIERNNQVAMRAAELLLMD